MCVIYCVPARPWLFALGGPGFRLADVPEAELHRIRDQVCPDFVWLQGVWELGREGRAHDLRDAGRCQHFQECLPGGSFQEADCIGSPYAIAAYRCNEAEVGSDEDLARFRERLKAEVGGASLMLDFVPNHVARDADASFFPAAALLPTKEALLKQGAQASCLQGSGAAARAAFGRDPYSGDWTDTAQLNYWSEACRSRMSDILLALARVCDGLRVDMAMLCCNEVVERTWGKQLREDFASVRPNTEFWPEAIRAAKSQNPGFQLVAECYEYQEIFPEGTGRQLLGMGFDAVYDKVLYDRLSSPSPTGCHLDNLRGHLAAHSANARGQVLFLENHDEARSALHFGAAAVACAVLVHTLPGRQLLFWGQELGKTQRLAVQLRRAAPEPEAMHRIAGVYSRLLPALRAPVFKRGRWLGLLPVHGGDAWRILAHGWKAGDREEGDDGRRACRLVVVNLTDAHASAEVGGLARLLEEGQSGGTVQLTDLLTGEAYDRDVGELLRGRGLGVVLGPFQAHLFAFAQG